jgi:hypothetical protein
MGRRSRYRRVRGHLVAITSALVVLVAAGCGTTSAPSAFTSLPQDTATTETTAPMTAVPVPETTVAVPGAGNYPTTTDPVTQIPDTGQLQVPVVQAPITRRAPITQAAPPKPADPVTSFGDGTFVVGTDIVAGTYKADPSGECYWARLHGTSDESDIIANHLASGPATVTIGASDGAFVSQRCGQWTKTSASLTSAGPVTGFDDGTYVVGTDVQAGTYKATPSGECYWARLRSTANESDIIANHLASGPTTVTISADDGAFLTQRCGRWTKVS